MGRRTNDSIGLALLVAIGCLAGCVPAPLGPYYRPIYPDASARYTGDACQGQAGAPASLSFVVADGVSIAITTLRTYGEKDRPDRPLRIAIGVPTGTQIQFLAKEIRIASSPQDSGVGISPAIDIAAAVLMPGNEVADFSRIAPTPFASGQGSYPVKNFSAATWLDFSWQDDFVPSAFSMEIPPILLLDVEQTDRQPIVLAARAKKRPESYPGEYKTQTSLVYATNEAESALAEKYAKCIRDKPAARCKDILTFDDAGFKVEKNGFRYSGRWYVHDVERHTPFSAELKIESEYSGRWRFASDQIRIVDSSGGAERVYRFASYPLSFSYQVPLDTPVRGVNTLAYRQTTTVLINSSLGTDELPRYFVKLPAVLINGKRYEIAPIELEKRTFDLGLEPFNC